MLISYKNTNLFQNNRLSKTTVGLSHKNKKAYKKNNYEFLKRITTNFLIFR